MQLGRLVFAAEASCARRPESETPSGVSAPARKKSRREGRSMEGALLIECFTNWNDFGYVALACRHYQRRRGGSRVWRSARDSANAMTLHAGKNDTTELHRLETSSGLETEVCFNNPSRVRRPIKRPQREAPQETTE